MDLDGLQLQKGANRRCDLRGATEDVGQGAVNGWWDLIRKGNRLIRIPHRFHRWS